ncbi:ABC transporter substrate-binding protein [Roseomonas sp. E05]|uniref:ABC transporter substrate-binding protein n=1 Tax=Roseomonas sp. E05 TaxID=3046310 RepID=UPI0024BA8949|nr:ABC transporter substrate-binding protein [Roseomonas sp. E05]MDJ0390033.1 ABC transporter substrate-binding protein [Roseomonas sp. E05]
MVRIRRRTLLGQAALALAARQAAAQGRAAGAAPELRIGAIFPFAGPLALHGDESFRGLEMAVEARNAAGGVFGRPLRLVKAEASDAAQAGEAARRLLAGPERVAALFGSCASAVSFAATQVAELEGVPYFELGAIADTITVRGFRYLFRSCPRGSDYAALTLRAARWLLPALWQMPPAAMQVAILHEDTLYGQSVATAQEVGLQGTARLLGRFGYAAGGQEIPALAQRLRAAETQLVLHTGQQAEILLLFRAMKEIGWRPRMVLGAGAGYSLADLAQALGPQVEGVMTVGFPPYLAAGRAGEEARQLAEVYRGKYGHDPRSGHSLANHAGARLFLEALHRAGSPDKERVRAAVLATTFEEREAPLGWAAGFDESGQNLRARPVLAQWQGGRLVPVFPEPAAAGVPRPQIG